MKLESGGSKGGVLIHSSLYSHGQSLEHRLETFSIVIPWGRRSGAVGGTMLASNGWRPETPTPYNTQDDFHPVEGIVYNVRGAELEKLWLRLLKICAGLCS